MMDVIAYEIRYFEQRIRHSVDMAAACTSPCGRQAHLTLADLYGLKVEELQGVFHAGSLNRNDVLSDAFAPTHADVRVDGDLPATTAPIAAFLRKSGTLSVVMA
ncbi:MAG: hypothetical protein A2095_06555 [Sphingomonadales bacterium GWF1_63_6]|nr:MAG: hypothetical protein A2095_06555 [Sphingomonadales bacterium GWF1_63_6]